MLFMVRIRKFLLPLLMALNTPFFGQSITVTGTVSDENGEAVPRATNLVKAFPPVQPPM